jgi:hypothetical protein
VLCALAAVVILTWDSGTEPETRGPTLTFDDVSSGLLKWEKEMPDEQRAWARGWRLKLQMARQARVRGDLTGSSAQYRQLIQEANARFGQGGDQPDAEKMPKSLQQACAFIQQEFRQQLNAEKSS